MSDDIIKLLQHFDGELAPYRENVRDSRRMFANEFSDSEQLMLLAFFRKQISVIVHDVLCGCGDYTADWILVINKCQCFEYCLVSMDDAILKLLGDKKVVITSRGSFHLGHIVLQRKGGDNGRSSANMLQFKCNPLLLFV